MRTVGLFKWRNVEGSSIKSRKTAALKDYVASKGTWPDVEIIVAETGAQFLEGDGRLGSILRSLEGARAIFTGFSDLSDSPSALLVGVSALIGQGTEVHTLELGAVEPHLRALRIGWTTGSAIEAELIAAREQHKASDTRWQKLFEETQRQWSQNAARKFPEMFSDTFALPEEVKPAVNGQDVSVDHAVIGQYLKQAREKAGITQIALGVRIGADPSAISRAEATGKGTLILRMFEVLSPDALPDSELQATLGVPDWYLAGIARSRLNESPQAQLHKTEE